MSAVRGPAEDQITNVALYPGARLGNPPLAGVMAFIGTAETVIGIATSQIAVR